MGLLTALTIAIHNFPEGLATFVATLDDPTVGAALAVVIAIHNIPEGLCDIVGTHILHLLLTTVTKHSDGGCCLVCQRS